MGYKWTRKKSTWESKPVGDLFGLQTIIQSCYSARQERQKPVFPQSHSLNCLDVPGTQLQIHCTV